MPAKNTVDVFPNSINALHQDPMIEQKAKRRQQQKWSVLIATLFLCIAVSLSWIWTRPPIYQSQAIIHFDYSQPFAIELATVPLEQIELNKQRLMSNRVVQAVQSELRIRYGFELSAQQLTQMVSVNTNNTSRVINLSATGHDSEVLAPVLDQWLKFYLSWLEEETDDSTSDDLRELEDKLALLEVKIDEQRLALAQYSDDNNIISLKRDENRAINRLKSMAESLDSADQQEATAIANLEAVEQFAAEGQITTHPADAATINSFNEQINALKADLNALAQRFTPQFMAMDPDIIAKQNNLATLEQQLEEFTELSSIKYIEELQLNIKQAKNNQQRLAVQMDDLSQQAKVFNQKLAQYSRMQTSLTQLETQSQALEDQITENEVQQPFRAKVTVIEPPFKPMHSIGPDYILHTGIAIVASIIISVLALLLVSFITRQSAAAASFTNYTVVPTQSPNGLTHEQVALLAQREQQLKTLGHQQTPLQLNDVGSLQSLRLLSVDECQQLYEVANTQAKLAIALVLHGLMPAQLSGLSSKHIAPELPGLLLDDQRQIRLSTAIFTLLNNAAESSDSDSVWAEITDDQGYENMLVNTAHDADLHFPDQVTMQALRHTYISYLVENGTKLNHLEQFAGYIDPTDLARYRSVKQKQQGLDVTEISTAYPIEYEGKST